MYKREAYISIFQTEYNEQNILCQFEYCIFRTIRHLKAFNFLKNQRAPYNPMRLIQYMDQYYYWLIMATVVEHCTGRKCVPEPGPGPWYKARARPKTRELFIYLLLLIKYFRACDFTGARCAQHHYYTSHS